MFFSQTIIELMAWDIQTDEQTPEDRFPRPVRTYRATPYFPYME